MANINMPSQSESLEKIDSLEDLARLPKIAVVIPCFRVKQQILTVLSKIGQECTAIYCIDDKCDQGSGEFILGNVKDPRVHVVFRDQNGGVGAATITGYRRALEDQCDIIVKLDGDGQMDPLLIPKISLPVLRGEADYAKGNRFYNLDSIMRMPAIRILGNAVLSLISKLSSGYWQITDPTNGFTAIDARLAKTIPLHLLSKRYFFESDLLFRLNTFKAVVVDVPMDSIYGNEVSNLHIATETFSFLKGHTTNFIRRIFYNYFLRDFSMATIVLIFGLILFGFGFIYGLDRLMHSSGVAASPGIVMLAALPVIVGIQFLLAFLNYDIANIPRTPISSKL
jgi:glycosyltransferase involved in cell wall biosynthesis